MSGEFVSVGDGTPSTTTRKRVSDALEQAQTKAADTKKAAKKAKRAKVRSPPSLDEARLTLLSSPSSSRSTAAPSSPTTSSARCARRMRRGWKLSARRRTRRGRSAKLTRRRWTQSSAFPLHVRFLRSAFGLTECCLTPYVFRQTVQIPGLAECAYHASSSRSPHFLTSSLCLQSGRRRSSGRWRRSRAAKQRVHCHPDLPNSAKTDSPRLNRREETSCCWALAGAAQGKED